MKIFFIKLISITIAVIIVINVLFNLFISNVRYIDTILSLTELQNRRELGDKLRNDLSDLLKKDYIIKKEDKILLYDLYQKLKLEFEEVQK